MALIKSPRHLDIEITSQCNLRCKYCYFFDSDHAIQELSTEEWLTFFDELGSIQVMDVTLAGGEPFYRKDFKKLINGIVRNRMRFTILSNGGLITDELAGFIAETGRCDSVQISLDGGSAERHDVFRGKGSFDAAVHGIRMLQKHNIDIDIRLTLHHKNVKHIPEAAHFILDTLGLYWFSVNSAGYMGTCKSYSEDIQLTTEDRVIAMRTLLDLQKEYPDRITATAGPLAEAKYWRSMIEARAAGKPATSGRLTACGCYFRKLAVQSDGSIVPCNLLPTVVLGKVNKDSVQDIWQNSDLLNSLRNRSKISLREFEMCQDCDYLDYCTGNCPGLAVSISGEVNHPAPDACLKKFLESGGIVP